MYNVLTYSGNRNSTKLVRANVDRRTALNLIRKLEAAGERAFADVA